MAHNWKPEKGNLSNEEYRTKYHIAICNGTRECIICSQIDPIRKKIFHLESCYQWGYDKLPDQLQEIRQLRFKIDEIESDEGAI